MGSSPRHAKHRLQARQKAQSFPTNTSIKTGSLFSREGAFCFSTHHTTFPAAADGWKAYPLSCLVLLKYHPLYSGRATLQTVIFHLRQYTDHDRAYLDCINRPSFSPKTMSFERRLSKHPTKSPRTFSHQTD